MSVAVRPGITELVEQMLDEPDLQRRWREDPSSVLKQYELTDEECDALFHGDVDWLLEADISERLTRRMKVDW